MIDTSIIRLWNIFIRIFSQKSAVKSILFRKDADNIKLRIKFFPCFFHSGCVRILRGSQVWQENSLTVWQHTDCHDRNSRHQMIRSVLWPDERYLPRSFLPGYHKNGKTRYIWNDHRLRPYLISPWISIMRCGLQNRLDELSHASRYIFICSLPKPRL